MNCLNLFYEEPDDDRWLPLDRYPRRIIRRIVRGTPRMGGQRKVFLNLCAGLDRLGVAYRVNDYRYIQKHPDEVACIIGKPHVLDKIPWKNPILFGASVFSHYCDDPDLFERLPVQKMLVPGEWMRKMCEPQYGQNVISWPVGIDTDEWKPSSEKKKSVDILIYDKVRWKHEEFEESLIKPIVNQLSARNLKVSTIRYGYYREEEFQARLQHSSAMLFLCEHETQGIAYQQALASNVPILAWDREGHWEDPAYFPERVRFSPVSSVPYWDSRCGVKFSNIHNFSRALDEFLARLERQEFAPRNYILDNLTLEKSAQQYLDIFREIQSSECCLLPAEATATA